MIINYQSLIEKPYKKLNTRSPTKIRTRTKRVETVYAIRYTIGPKLNDYYQGWKHCNNQSRREIKLSSVPDSN